MPYKIPLSRIDKRIATEEVDASLIAFQCFGRHDIKNLACDSIQSGDIESSRRITQPMSDEGPGDLSTIHLQYAAAFEFHRPSFVVSNAPWGIAASIVSREAFSKENFRSEKVAPGSTD